MTPNIKEKVLKEEWEKVKDQIEKIAEEHPYPEGKKGREYDWWINAIVNIKMVKEAEILAEVGNVIDEDTEYQESQLTGDYEKDKPIKWRLEGYKHIKQKLGIK